MRKSIFMLALCGAIGLNAFPFTTKHLNERKKEMLNHVLKEQGANAVVLCKAIDSILDTTERAKELKKLGVLKNEKSKERLEYCNAYLSFENIQEVKGIKQFCELVKRNDINIQKL